MRFIAKLWEMVVTAIWLAAIAVFGLLILGITLIVTPFVLVFQRVFRRGAFKPIPPDVLESFDQGVAAVENGDIGYLDEQLARDTDFVNSVDGFIGRRWIMNAVDLGAPETVRWFIDLGADLNFRDEEGRCLLDGAIQREGDQKSRVKTGGTVAPESDAVKILTMLLDAGADVNLPDVLQSTPLHFAAVHGSARLVQVLLDRGADPLAYHADYVPKTPIHCAQAAKRPEIAELMRAHVGRGTIPLPDS